MRISRATSNSVSRLLIAVLLFAQFAVASYACPSLMGRATMSEGHAGMVMTADMAPGCDQIDPTAANLCAEHCRHGLQSVDTANLPAAFSAIPALLYSVPIEPAPSPGSGRSFPAPDASLVAAHSPPHTILHCVFRI